MASDSNIISVMGQLRDQQIFYNFYLLIDPGIHISELGFDHATTALDGFVRFDAKFSVSVSAQEQILLEMIDRINILGIQFQG